MIEQWLVGVRSIGLACAVLTAPGVQLGADYSGLQVVFCRHRHTPSEYAQNKMRISNEDGQFW